MSRIQNDSSQISDYYASTPETVLEESAIKGTEPRSAKEHPLSQQMDTILQNFTSAMNETNAGKRSSLLQGSMGQVDNLQKDVRQFAAQSGMDISDIMQEVNLLMKKMRDTQRDNAIQQQQQAISLQQSAFKNTQESINENKSASNKKALSGVIGASIGALGGAFKVGGGITSGKTAIGLGVAGDIFSTATPLGTTGGEMASVDDNSRAQQATRQADQQKELQKLNETDYDRKEGDARDASQQMRSIQQQMTELYGKIISAVRW